MKDRQIDRFFISIWTEVESDGGSAEISQFMVEICGEIPDARFSSVEAERVRVD